MTTQTAAFSTIRPIVVLVTDSAKAKNATLARELDFLNTMLLSLIGEVSQCEADTTLLNSVITNIASA